MSLYYPPFDSTVEPNQQNIRSWMENMYMRMSPYENARWNEANIDSLFYAGCQQYVNRYFGYNGQSQTAQLYFNLAQTPINMLSGYERQNRKGFMYQATEGGDDQTTDQYTKLITHEANVGGIHEAKSRAKELSMISGLTLVQPYLDFNGDDNAQGSMKSKIWEYSSFMTDPFWRNPDMSDCQAIWCQEYIPVKEAKDRYGDKIKGMMGVGGPPYGLARFYFLPENYTMSRSDMMIQSYIWYKWKKKKKRLYSKSRNQFFDFAGGQENMEDLLYSIPDMEQVTVDAPTWRVAVVLNDQLMFQGDNPLGDFCPFVPYYWNRDPHLAPYELRDRSLMRSMRSSQFLFNWKVVNNNDIASATINAGWKRKVGAVANEDNLKKAGNGYDVIINEGYELTDAEKIIPSAVPESDLAFAEQFKSLIFGTSGIDMEKFSGVDDKQISSLTLMLKQAANLMVFQKFFDQWDYSDKLLGDKLLQIALNNWNAFKVKLIIGEEPSPFFYSRVFSKYKVMVEESDLTPTQQNLQARQMIEINHQFGREVFSPSMIIPKLNITGKGEIIPYLKQQEQQMSAVEEHNTTLQHAVEEGKLKELYSKIAQNIATARERHGRAEADIGLYEERLSEITHNRAMSMKAKTEALAKLMEVIQKYGEIEAHLKMNDLKGIEQDQINEEDVEKRDAQSQSLANEFVSKFLTGNISPVN
jgi:hypothetical protein